MLLVRRRRPLPFSESTSCANFLEIGQELLLFLAAQQHNDAGQATIPVVTLPEVNQRVLEKRGQDLRGTHLHDINHLNLAQI